MTAEHIHDALTLLPSDLVVAADAKRNKQKKVIHWQRWAAMAACFAIVFCLGSFSAQFFGPKGASQAADMEAAPAEAVPEAPAAMMAPMEEFSIVENGELQDELTAAAPAAGDTAASAEKEPLPGPPILEIASESSGIQIEASSFSWTVPQKDGTSSTMTTDAPHPLDHPEYLPILDTVQETVALLWDTMPDSITAQCWNILEQDSSVNVGAVEAAVANGNLTVKQGTYVYEITAHWPEGTACYAFQITAP